MQNKHLCVLTGCFVRIGGRDAQKATRLLTAVLIGVLEQGSAREAGLVIFYFISHILTAHSSLPTSAAVTCCSVSEYSSSGS